MFGNYDDYVIISLIVINLILLFFNLKKRYQ